MKIPWSGRSHDFEKKDLNFLINIIKSRSFNSRQIFKDV